MMNLRLAFWAGLATAAWCWAQPTYPIYPYFVPAIAQNGGPAYVIPGNVTQNSMIGFTVTGQACEQNGDIDCLNAAGVITLGSTTRHTNVGEASAFTGTFGGFTGKFKFGALLMSIEGVGTVQVFPANAANGLHSSSPPQNLTLLPTTFAGLGFPRFQQKNARIIFYVADTYYPDNSQGFLLRLQSPAVEYDTHNPSFKVKQLNGPCDWAAWNLGQGPCVPTAATKSKSEVLGNDLGYSFELNRGTPDRLLYFLFGDTIGVQLPLNSPSQGNNTYPEFNAADALAFAALQHDAANFTLDFFPTSPNPPQFVQPVYPSGAKVPMEGDDVANSGIDIGGKVSIVVHTGSDGSLSNPQLYDYSLLVQPENGTLIARTTPISVANVQISANPPSYKQTGHFVYIALAELPLAYAQQIGLAEPAVLMMGNGEHRSESIYLAYTPVRSFSINSDNSATMYFTGLDANGMPTWSNTEMSASPVVWDNPTGLPTGPGYPDPGTAGEVSLQHRPDLGIWLLTWDGGRQGNAPAGIYFSTASAPWGPWSAPQRIYDPCYAHAYGQGYGDFIRYVVGKKDVCAGQVKDQTGPAGPIIGTGSDPFLGVVPSTGETATTRRGVVYAPYMIPGLTATDGSTLTIHYNMSTWNPYTSVIMESNFTITPPVFAY